MDVPWNKVQTCAQELQITAFQQAQIAATSLKLNLLKSITFNFYGRGRAAEAEQHMRDIPASMFGDAIRNKHALKYSVSTKSLEKMMLPCVETFLSVNVGSWSVSGRSVWR